MDKIARFAILGLFPFKRYGNRNCFKSRFDSRVTRRIFSLLGFYFRTSFWLYCLLSSPALIAEFSSDDSDNLLLISQEVFNIHTKVSSIESSQDILEEHTKDISNLYKSLGYTNYYAGQGTLKQDILVLRDYLSALSGQNQSILKGMGSTSQTTWSGETLGVKLDKILSAIEALDTPDSGSGGETFSDFATETTLSAFKGQYEQLANQFLNSWGFSQEYNLKGYLDYIVPGVGSNFSIPYLRFSAVGAETSPYPDTVDRWVSWQSRNYNLSQSGSFLEDFFNALSARDGGIVDLDLRWRKKQAWNDWYAHTNLVDTLYLLSSPPKNYIDSSSDIGSVDSSTGEMILTYNDSEGGSPPTPEVIDTKVVFTNDFSVLQTDSNSIGENLNRITYSKLNEKYKLPEGIENNNYQDYSSKEALPDYTLQYGPKQYQTFRFTSKHRTMYNSIFSPQLCDKLRGVFSKLWFFLSIWFNFVLFKIFGKVKE